MKRILAIIVSFALLCTSSLAFADPLQLKYPDGVSYYITMEDTTIDLDGFSLILPKDWTYSTYEKEGGKLYAEIDVNRVVDFLDWIATVEIYSADASYDNSVEKFEDFWKIRASSEPEIVKNRFGIDVEFADPASIDFSKCLESSISNEPCLVFEYEDEKSTSREYYYLFGSKGYYIYVAIGKSKTETPDEILSSILQWN